MTKLKISLGVILIGVLILVNIFMIIQSLVPYAEARPCSGEFGYTVEIRYGDGDSQYLCICNPDYEECCGCM